MDNAGVGKTGGNQGGDKPIPLDDLNKPIPLQGVSTPGGGVSRAPLSLGGTGQAPPQRPAVSQPAAQRAAPVASVSDRITGVRTFFTKLHPGALNFLDEQMTNWLKQNPNIRIKHTNTTVGDVQEKKTEPNIIVTIWY